MRYYIKYHGQEEKEVTQEEYRKVAEENNNGFVTPSDTVPYLFYGSTASGRINPEDNLKDIEPPSGALMW